MAKTTFRSIACLVVGFYAVSCSCVFSACENSVEGMVALAAPQNLHSEGRTLVWDEVENATGYVVRIESSEYEITENYYNLSELTVPDDYDIKVLAYGDGIYLNSVWTEYTYTVEIAVEQGYDEEGWKYTLLDDGSGYELSLGSHSAGGNLIFPDYYKGLPVKRIADNMFQVNSTAYNWNTGAGCNTSLKSARLPKCIEEIGIGTFAYCIELTEVENLDKVKVVGDGAFKGCIKLEAINISTSLESIGSAAFSNCYSLTEVIIPDGLTTVSRGAFYGCRNLQSVTIPDTVTSIGDMAFQNCYKLTSITTPESVSSIGNEAFADCSYLQDVTLLCKNFTYLGYHIFYNTAWFDLQPSGYVLLNDNILYCYKFGDINTLGGYTYPTDTVINNIPDTVKYVAGGAFYGCKNLQSVAFDDGVRFLGGYIFYKCGVETVTLPSDLTTLYGHTFYECSLQNELVLPSSLKEIGEYEFFCCGGAKNCRTLTIPSSVTKISSMAFYYAQFINVTFENPNGWWYSEEENATEGVAIPAEELSDTTSAATSLKSTYVKYYLYRS